ncbi:MAG: DUF805 domain-containing protein [Sutterellaceae bacterium]|nr:DUF805 domain-containing protein [Sutterellaceae bacterium]
MKLFGDLLLFDRTKLGRVDRATYWRTIFAYALIFSTTFVVPFEAAYRLELAPDSFFVALCVNGWVLLWFFSVMPLWRLTRRRLHDADFSAWWQWLIWLPFVGWAILLVLLLQPSSVGQNRFDRFAEPENRV